MRIILFVALAIFLVIAWKMVKLARAMRSDREDGAERPRVEFPPDQAYRNIEDADFEDLDRDSGKGTP